MWRGENAHTRAHTQKYVVQEHLLTLFTSIQVMIYELADHIQSFLSEYNKPPTRSFHEEMLKNLQRQQEKRAQEERQKMDQQRKQEEEMVMKEDEV